jgi:hypothetical protein
VPLAAPLDARRGLLAGLIDHAPMFPPEELPLAEALAAHEKALHSEPGWIVNRFVVRASQLPDLPPERPHRLSVVKDADMPDDPRIEAIEIPPTAPGTADVAVWPRRDPEIEIYLERSVQSWAKAPSGLPMRAKIRCGPTPPSIDELAAAIRALRDHGKPFKATAGLHHAVRTGDQHGFVNLLAAAAFDDVEDALAETDPSAFSLDEEAFRWRDWEAAAEDVATLRREVFVSFGSCSFDEPVEELRALGFL